VPLVVVGSKDVAVAFTTDGVTDDPPQVGDVGVESVDSLLMRLPCPHLLHDGVLGEHAVRIGEQKGEHGPLSPPSQVQLVLTVHRNCERPEDSVLHDGDSREYRSGCAPARLICPRATLKAPCQEIVETVAFSRPTWGRGARRSLHTGRARCDGDSASIAISMCEPWMAVSKSQQYGPSGRFGRRRTPDLE